MRRAPAAGLLLLAICLVPAHSANASFHLMLIDEIFLGSAANPTAQYVVLRMTAAGQNLVAGQSIEVQDATGATLADFGAFAASPPSGASNGRIIMGTADAATLFGITLDGVVTGALPPVGRICWTALAIDCVAYGAFTGTNTGFGTPAAAPPLGMALARVSSSSPRDNSVDFVACDPHPINNEGVMGGTSPTFCGICPNGFVSTGEACDDGNTSSTDACLATCAAASCGDGFVRATAPAEQCDDGAANSDTVPDACRTNCTNASCGDGVVDTGETCDEGLLNSNTTPDACRTSCLPAACGDGVVDTGEECDAGAANSDTLPNACRTACLSPACGDGVQDAGEGCDDGNLLGGDGCGPTCVGEGCGDGVLDAGEECDDGPANSDTSPDACRTSCLSAFCGDAVLDTGEACDDGNVSNGDACVGACVAATCGDGFVLAGFEGCDDGAANSDMAADACRTSCTPAGCGDGVTDTGEACDDGNAADGDACLSTCVANLCGDGFVLSGVEECDDGTANSDSMPDACRSNCQNAFCGDYVPDTGEDCDDQNTSNEDGCLNTCEAASCGDGFAQAGVEECDPPDVAAGCDVDCSAIESTDAGPGTDGGAPGSDSGVGDVGGGGCACRAAGEPRPGAGASVPGALLAGMAFAGLLVRRLGRRR